MIALTAAAPDAETVALGRALRALGEVVLVSPHRPPGLDADVVFVEADLSTTDSAEAGLAAAEERVGELRCVISAPASAVSATVLGTSDDLWRATLAANETVAMHVARAAARRMTARGNGRIALVGWRLDRASGWAHLAAASGAIAQLARSLAAEVGAQGVTVNGVLVPPGGLADAAGAVRLLVSPDAGYITAEVLRPGPARAGTFAPNGPDGLTGRAALVTGAGQGIGAAVAHRLGRAGCLVAVNSLQPDKAEKTAARIRSVGGAAEPFPADVGDVRAVDDMFAAIESKLGLVSIVVNNAAVLSMTELVEMDPSDWHRQTAVDLTGPFQVSRRALGAMVEAGWGRIVNVSSIWGLVGARGAAPYSAAKGGLIELTRALSEEVGPVGVRVSAIAPGVVSTPQLAADAAFAGITIPEMEARYAEDTLVGRIATPEEIAGVVAFLASDAGAPFEGQTVPVTGGRSE